MFIGGPEIVKLVDELVILQKAHLAARLEDMAKPKDDFEKFANGLMREKV